MNYSRTHGDRDPVISVVTICKNAVRTIERALTSVINSGYPALQYIIVDGGSTDGTLDVIERYRKHLYKFISEPDNGISDALNKAVALTDTDYHIVIHADDELLPEAIHKLAMPARVTPSPVVCGKAIVISGAKVIRVFEPQPKKLTQKMSIPHMGALIRKDAWQTVGGYDLRKRIAMDHLFMLKILKHYGLQGFTTIDTVVARYALGGVSDHFALNGFREVRENLIEMGISRPYADYAYAVLRAKYMLTNFMRSS